MNKFAILIVTALTLIMLFALGSFFYQGHEAEKIKEAAREDTMVFAREYSQTLGSDEAKVVVSEFLDPGCETCREFHPFLKEMLKYYSGKVSLVIRYAPLHQGSDTMVSILEASREQDKYWETLEVMYSSQPHWASHANPQPEKIWQFLPDAGLDIARLKDDMRKPEIEQIIAQDMADARALNVTKTPQFFVNGKPLLVFGYDELAELVESEVRKNYPN